MVGLVAACSESTAPGDEQALDRKKTLTSRFTCPESGPYVDLYDVNAAGAIIGSTVHRGYEVVTGFVCDNKRGVSSDLGTLGGPETSPAAINASGAVVGTSTRPDGKQHAFLWEHGVMTDLGTLPGDDASIAHAISDAGQVVGESFRAGDGYGTSRAFLWQKGVMVDLGTLPGTTWSSAHAINARGQVVGTSGTGWLESDRRAFLWQDGHMIPLETWGLGSFAGGINAAGQIVGAAETATGEWHAAVWYRGAVTDLGSGWASAINNAGVVVGRSDGGAVFWRKGVKTVLEAGENPGEWYGVGYEANAINSSGLVVGSGFQQGGSWPAVWTIR
jgi:probable HAF family extracellular repeat protein